MPRVQEEDGFVLATKETIAGLLRELVARINAVLRRSSGEATAEILRSGAITLDRSGREVKVSGQKVSLTPTEFDLLALMMGSPGRVFTRTQLVEHLVDRGFSGVERTLNVHVRNLRMKIESDPGNPRYIETVFGIGYRMQKLA